MANAGDSDPITFLMHDAFSGGGVARTTTNLANHLAQTRDVRVISLYRRRRHARFELDDSIDVTVLDDLRQPSLIRSRLRRLPSRLRPMPSKKTMSLLSDLLLRRAIRDVRSGVIVSTRPSLHLALTSYARPEVTTVGWEHLNYVARSQSPRLIEV